MVYFSTGVHRFQSTISWPYCFGPKVIIAEGTAKSNHYSWPESKGEEKMKGRGFYCSLQRHSNHLKPCCIPLLKVSATSQRHLLGASIYHVDFWETCKIQTTMSMFSITTITKSTVTWQYQYFYCIIRYTKPSNVASSQQ